MDFSIWVNGIKDDADESLIEIQRGLTDHFGQRYIVTSDEDVLSGKAQNVGLVVLVTGSRWLPCIHKKPAQPHCVALRWTLQNRIPVIPVLVPPAKKLEYGDLPATLRSLAAYDPFIYQDGNAPLGKVNDWLDHVGKILDKLKDITKRPGCVPPRQAGVFDDYLEKAGKAFEVLGALVGKDKLKRLISYIEHGEYLIDKALMTQIGTLLKSLKGLHESMSTLVASVKCFSEAVKVDLQKAIKDGEGLGGPSEPPRDGGRIYYPPPRHSRYQPPMAPPATEPKPSPITCLVVLLLVLVVACVAINPLNIHFNFPHQTSSPTTVDITPTATPESEPVSFPVVVGCQIAPAEDWVNIRQYPGTEYPIVGTLYRGDGPTPVSGYAYAASGAPYYLVSVRGIWGWITGSAQYTTMSGDCALDQLKYADPGFPPKPAPVGVQPPQEPPKKDEPQQPNEQPAVASFSIALTTPSDGTTKLEFVNGCFSLTYFAPAPELEFRNSSIGGNQIYLWDFGDAVTSTLQNPTHVYTMSEGKTGTFTIKLDAYNTDKTFSETSACLVVTRTFG